MAIDGSDGARVNRVLTTTLDRYSAKISNELARNDGVIGVLGAKGRIKVVDGGERAIETLDVSENSNFAFRSAYSDVPTNRQDSRRQAKYAWATIDGSVVLNDVEAAMNSGSSKIYDLMEAEVNNAYVTMKRQIADALRAATPGDTDPESVLSIVEDNDQASQTGSPGGIDKSTSTYWRNQYSNTSMDLSASTGWESLLAFYLQSCSKGTGLDDQPDFGLTNGTLFAALAAGAGDANRRYLGADQDMLKLGFSNIKIMNASVICDVSVASGDVYFLNTKYLGIQVLRTPSIKTIGTNPQTLPISVRPFMTDPKSLHSVALMYSTFALTCASCQRQGIASNCS